MPQFTLSGHTAIVTGAGRGIGRAIALGLAEAGARVVVADLHRENAEAVSEEIAALGASSLALGLDISRVAEIEAGFARLDAEGWTPDIAVLAAGVLRVAPLLEQTEEDWTFLSDVNLKGTFFTLQAAARRMIERQGGSILLLASTSAFVASRVPEILYDVTKGGVRQMAISAAVELAPHDIRVNALAPGTIRTDFNRATLHDPDAIRAAEERLPMGRLGMPDDVAGAAVFLCSPAAAYITGHVLAVDGGRLARAG